jgi:hypothetical protein
MRDGWWIIKFPSGVQMCGDRTIKMTSILLVVDGLEKPVGGCAIEERVGRPMTIQPEEAAIIYARWPEPFEALTHEAC